jgi:hypothetical protein
MFIDVQQYLLIESLFIPIFIIMLCACPSQKSKQAAYFYVAMVTLLFWH